MFWGVFDMFLGCFGVFLICFWGDLGEWVWRERLLQVVFIYNDNKKKNSNKG